MSDRTLRQVIEDLVDQRINERFSELLAIDLQPPRPSRPAAARWSEDEKRAVVEDALSGMSLPQMARKYGRTQGAIRLRLYGKKAGLLRKSNLAQPWQATS
jgi:hypothetical protein